MDETELGNVLRSQCCLLSSYHYFPCKLIHHEKTLRRYIRLTYQRRRPKTRETWNWSLMLLSIVYVDYWKQQSVSHNVNTDSSINNNIHFDFCAFWAATLVPAFWLLRENASDNAVLRGAEISTLPHFLGTTSKILRNIEPLEQDFVT